MTVSGLRNVESPERCMPNDSSRADEDRNNKTWLCSTEFRVQRRELRVADERQPRAPRDGCDRPPASVRSNVVKTRNCGSIVRTFGNRLRGSKERSSANRQRRCRTCPWCSNRKVLRRKLSKANRFQRTKTGGESSNADTRVKSPNRSARKNCEARKKLPVV